MTATTLDIRHAFRIPPTYLSAWNCLFISVKSFIFFPSQNNFDHAAGETNELQELHHDKNAMWMYKVLIISSERAKIRS